MIVVTVPYDILSPQISIRPAVTPIDMNALVIFFSKLFGVFPLFEKNYVYSILVVSSLTALTVWSKVLHYSTVQNIWYQEVYTLRGFWEILGAWTHLYFLRKNSEELDEVMRKLQITKPPKSLIWIVLLVILELVSSCSLLWKFMQNKFDWFANIVLIIDDILMSTVIVQFYTMSITLASDISNLILTKKYAVLASEKCLKIIRAMKLVNTLFSKQNLVIILRLTMNLIYFTDLLRRALKIYFMENEYKSIVHLRYVIAGRLLNVTRYVCLIFMLTRSTTFSQSQVGIDTSYQLISYSSKYANPK